MGMIDDLKSVADDAARTVSELATDTKLLFTDRIDDFRAETEIRRIGREVPADGNSGELTVDDTDNDTADNDTADNDTADNDTAEKRTVGGEPNDRA